MVIMAEAFRALAIEMNKAAYDVRFNEALANGTAQAVNAPEDSPIEVKISFDTSGELCLAVDACKDVLVPWIKSHEVVEKPVRVIFELNNGSALVLQMKPPQGSPAPL